MDTKDMILELRTKMGLSQDELAEKVFVTRQAVSRWENGETTPNIETLKLLSKPLQTGTSAGSQTAFSMRSTASGAMLTASICTTI